MLILLLLLTTITISLYFVESSENMGFSKYKPILDVSYVANEYILTWPKIPYFAYYEVEVLNQNPGDGNGAQSALPAYRIVKYRTFENTIKIDQQFPKSAYLRVSAHSLFHKPLGFYSNSVPITELSAENEETLLKPVPLTLFPQHSPAPNIPLLVWRSVPGAVYYEIEFLSNLPENPNGIQPSLYQVSSSREVFTNGYSIDLSNYPTNQLYWRVRALDYHGEPIGVYSDATALFIDHTLRQVLKPVSNTGYKAANIPMPLYPVYSWIPIAGAINYEVELTTSPPENPNGTQASKYQIRRQIVKGATDCYDEDPLITPGTYYWRVRGLDEIGRPVGGYSDAEQFTVDPTLGKYAITFGDSITHGGGAISYSPADVEYSFQTYLSFSTINVGKSGDTSESMLSRFDRDVVPYHSKFIIIMGGSNSLRGGARATQVIKELTAIRDKCLANGSRPIFLTLPPINPEAINQAFNESTIPDWQKEFSAVNFFIRQQRYYIDLEPYFMDANHELPTYYATDGLHLDIEGKKLMGLIINANWARVTK